jgi:hypothetical protein
MGGDGLLVMTFFALSALAVVFQKIIVPENAPATVRNIKVTFSSSVWASAAF